MTKEEILTMKAGIEIDKQIALMLGYTILEGSFISGTPLHDVYQIQDKYGYLEKLPFYSTDIRAAWQVVEKMRELGYFYSIKYGYTFLSPGDPSPKPGCSFWSGVTPYDCGSASADLVPEAICKAALLAKLGVSG